MSIHPQKNNLKTSNWVFSSLHSLLNFGRTLRRHSCGAKSTSRLLLTELEDRVTPTTLHWLGSSAANGNLWSVASNWLEDQAPLSGDQLVFDTAIAGFSPTTNGFSPTNDISGLTNLAIAINNSSSAGDFTISGDSIGLITSAGIGITCTLSAGTVSSPAEAIDNDITLGANTTIDVGLGSLTLGGVISGGFSLTAAGSPSSTLTLNAANTYSGGTVLTSGTVAVGANTSLGTAAFTFNGGTLTNAGAFLQVPNSFVVAIPSTIGGGGFFTLDGNGTLNATLSLDYGAFLSLDGALSGAGGLIENGGTTLGGTAPNTFTGGVSIVSGGITLQKTAGVNAVVSPITIVGSSSLSLNASDQINGNASVDLGQGSTFSTNGYSDTVASLTGPGAINIGSTATAGLTITGGGNQLLTGSMSGSGLLTYDGSGSLTLAGASSSYSGTLTAAGGALIIDANFSEATAAATGGTLGGTGIVKSIAATSGYVNPATAGAGGILNTVSSSSSVASSLNGATFTADLASQGPSDGLSLGANATLNLTGANLTLNDIGSTLATSYQIVTSPTGGLSGSFNFLPGGSTISAGSQSFEINYSPYAVTLTNLDSGPTTLHWIGATSSNWSVAGNWEEETMPVSGDTLVFDTSTHGFAATTAAFAPTNDLNGLTNIAIVVNDNSTAGDFVISGNGLGLVTTAGVGIASSLAAGTVATINNPLALAANTTVDVGLGALTLGGTIGGNFSLTMAGPPGGTLTLNSANTYSGGTIATSGILSVNTNTSLGTGTLTLNGGTLANSTAFLDVANPIVVSTLSTIGGGSFFNLEGNIVLNANLQLTNGGFLTLSGAISGTGGLIVDGFPGYAILSGTTANTFTGPTTVIGGDLELDKSAGVNALGSSTLSLGGGAFPSLSWSANDQINGGASVYLGASSSLSTNGHADTLHSLTGIGSVNDTSTTGTGLTVTGNGPMVFSGTVSGSGLLSYDGSGSLTLAGASTSFTGQLDAQAGTLLVDADFSGAAAIATGGGILGGTGIVKELPSTGNGTLNPGGSGIGGILTAVSGSNNSAIAGETFQVDIADNALSDELVIGGTATIDLANSTLSVDVLHSTFGSTYTIIASPTGGISGTFTGRPNGSAFDVSGVQFTINYSTTAVTLTTPYSLSQSSLSVSSGTVQSSSTTTVSLQTKDGNGNDLASGGLNVGFILGNPYGGQGLISNLSYAGNGLYEAELTGTIAGSNTIIATINGQPILSAASSITVTVGPVDPANSLLTLSAPVPSIQIGGTTTITLLPRDYYGNDESTADLSSVSFALEGDSVTGTIGKVTNNKNGTYTALFTGKLDGTDTITADVNGSPISSTLPIAVAGGAVSLSESTATLAASSLTAGETTNVTLQAKYPTEMDEPAGGLTVTFKLGSATGAQGTFSAVTDHGNGLYTAVFTSTHAGANTIKAYIDGKAVSSPSPKLTVEAGPLDLANSPVAISATSMKANGKVTLTFQPEDAGGNTLNLGDSILPVFSLESGTGTFLQPVSYNKATGSFSVTFTTTTSGSDTFETMYNGQSVTSKAPRVTVLVGPVSLTNTLVNLSQQDVQSGTPLTVTLQAEDAYGNLEPEGLPINFMLGSGSGKGQFGKVTYMGDGVYEVTFTPSSAGTDAIEAEVSGAKIKSAAILTVLAG